jgi:hypothetical protein
MKPDPAAGRNDFVQTARLGHSGNLRPDRGKMSQTGVCAERLEAAGDGRQDARRYDLGVVRSCATLERGECAAVSLPEFGPAPAHFRASAAALADATGYGDLSSRNLCKPARSSVFSKSTPACCISRQPAGWSGAAQNRMQRPC